jgi:hypothetical protein
MTPSLRVRTSLVLVLLAVGAAQAEAQTIPSPYRFIEHRHEAGGFVASVPGNRGEMGLGPGGGVMLGGRYAIEVGGPFALEGTAFLLPTDRRILAPGEEDGQIDRIGTADVMVGAIDGRVRFTLTGARTWRGLAPFVLAGGGIAVNLQGRAELEEEMPTDVRFDFGPTFLGTLGTGVRWLPGDRVTVRADLGLHLWKVGTPVAFTRREDLAPVPQQEWTSVSHFSLGLSYRF